MSSKEQQRYFNFPIVLLEGFLVDEKRVLKNIHAYATYVQAISYYVKEGFDWTVNEDIEKAVALSDSYFGITTNNKLKVFETGSELYDSIPVKTPKVGLSIVMFLDYYGNDKEDFQKVCLLGFLAIKGILQNKSYCKIANNFWLSRMDWKAKAVNEVYGLSEPIKKYANIYQTRKIKSELEREWNLKTVSGRGFNVSFKMTIEALTYEVFKKRKKYKDLEIKKAKDEAKKEALKRLYGTPP